MQELLYPLTAKYDDDFDDFELEKIKVLQTVIPRYIVMFKKQANNGKHIYLVGDRWKTVENLYLTENILEFKHSRDRAEQEYKERVYAAE